METKHEGNAKDLSVSMVRLQILVLPFIFASLLLLIPYALIWGVEAFATAWKSFFDSFVVVSAPHLRRYPGS